MPEAVRITLSVGPTARAAKTNDDTTDPALVFQTVCRLNLAGVSSSPGLTGSSKTADETGAQPDAGATGGKQ